MTDSLRSEFMSGLDEIERATDPNAWAASAGPSNVKAKPAKPADAEETVTDAEDTVTDTVSEAEDTVEEAATDAEDAVEDTTAEAQDTVSDTVEDTVAEATEAEDPIEETAADGPDASAAETNGSAPSNGSTPPEQAESETAEPVDPDPRESA